MSDDYLWDKSGTPDEDVQRLEQLLAPFAHDGRPLGRWRSTWRWWAGAAAAAAVITIAVVWAFSPAAIQLVKPNGETLRRHEWIATADDEVVLELGDMGEITLLQRSRMRVDRLREDRTRLHLEKGGLHAFVYADAAPRFFEVGTPATTCVDLGCEYTLRVDEVTGDVDVAVELGRVAFQDNGREIYVPRNATCHATKAHGAGTPRYTDTPAPLAALLDRFDTRKDVGGARLKLAQEILSAVVATKDDRFTLIAWHFLQDSGTDVRVVALRWLMSRHQRPSGASANQNTPPSAADRERWKKLLSDLWW